MPLPCLTARTHTLKTGGMLCALQAAAALESRTDAFIRGDGDGAGGAGGGDAGGDGSWRGGGGGIGGGGDGSWSWNSSLVDVSESWSEDEDERSDSWGGDGVGVGDDGGIVVDPVHELLLSVMWVFLGLAGVGSAMVCTLKHEREEREQIMRDQIAETRSMMYMEHGKPTAAAQQHSSHATPRHATPRHANSHKHKP
jgi:hypothetical protein